jgi:hypothetical protein
METIGRRVPRAVFDTAAEGLSLGRRMPDGSDTDLAPRIAALLRALAGAGGRYAGAGSWTPPETPRPDAVRLIH